MALPAAMLLFGAGCDIGGVPTPPRALAFNTIHLQTSGLADLVIDDLDGDGILDYAAHSIEFGTVVRYGLGNRLFGDEIKAGGGGGGPIAVADFDEDGRIDLMVADPSLDAGNLSQLKLFPGAGERTFGPPRIIASDDCLSGTTRMIAGDFAENHRSDLAVLAARDQSVNLYFNMGKSAFGPCVPFTVGRSPSVAVAADFDGDHRLDLAVLASEGNKVAVLLGSPGPNHFVAQPFVPLDLSPVDLAVGDIDGDGAPDLVIAHASGKVSFQRNLGHGRFSPSVADLEVPNVKLVALADFDADGRIDLAIGTETALEIRLGDGAGGFGAPIWKPISVGGDLRRLIAVDLDGDGRVDLISASGTGQDVAITFNDPR